MRCDCARPRRAFSLLELIAVVAIIAIVVGLTLSGVQRVRAAAARTACTNNLHQIGLGLENYHSAKSHFPSGVTTRVKDPDDYLHMGWHTRLLPYVEQDAVWRQAVDAYAQSPSDFTRSPHPLGNVIKIYGCPSDGRVAQPQSTRGKYIVGLTSYVGMSGSRTVLRDGMLFRDSAIRHTDVTDGSSNTIFVGERPPSTDFWFGWWYAGIGSNGLESTDMILGAADRSPANDAYVPDCGLSPGGFKPGRFDSMCSAFHYWSPHTDGGNFLFVDGSVRFLNYSANAVFKQLATRSGGDAVEIP